MKGVILAGGTGSRLHPLTRITNKHLLPIYDRPMISYAIEVLVGAGLLVFMLVTGGTHAGEYDLAHPRADQDLDSVADHRPVVDRQQVLVGDAREWVQPASGPAGQDDALHRADYRSADGRPTSDAEHPSHRL